MRSLVAFFFLLTAVMARAASASDGESYMAMYLQGQRIGYVVSTTVEAELDGKPVKRTDSKTVMDAGLMGTSLKVSIESTTWSDDRGQPIQMSFRVSSGGREQRTSAVFAERQILVTIDNAGQVTNKTIERPADARIVDDVLAALLEDEVPTGTSRTYYVLDPMMGALMKNEIVLKGPSKVEVDGKTYDARLIEIIDPRASSSVYLSAKGDLIKMIGPMGMEIRPVSKEAALAEIPAADRKTIDLAFSTAISPDKPLGEPSLLERVTVRLSGPDLARIPSDAHQTVRKEGASWIIEVHPPSFAGYWAPTGGGTPITVSAEAHPDWLRPSLYIPSQSERFRTLALEIIGTEDTVKGASEKIARHVFKIMKPNAGIGVLRDATEVLETREGVCRDYAILTATLLRGAGIPTQVVSGLIYHPQHNKFYYHAWVEVWDGSWIGLDSTLPNATITPGHIKLSNGNVEEAFTFTFLDSVRLEVLDVKRR
jgi:hypothetical protein